MKNLSKNAVDNIVNTITKDIGEETKIVISTGKFYPKNIPDYVMIFQKITEQLIKGLQPAATKVFLYMICKLQYSNHIGVDQVTIADECNLSVRTVNGSIKELLELQMIILYRDLQDKRRKVYMINPYTAWKGKMQQRKKAIKQMDSSQTSLLFPKQ